MLSEHNRCPPDPEPGEHRLHRVLAGRKLRRTVLPLDVGLDRDHRLLDLSTEVDEVEGDPRGRGGWKRGAALINEGRLPQDAWRRTTPASHEDRENAARVQAPMPHCPPPLLPPPSPPPPPAPAPPPP